MAEPDPPRLNRHHLILHHRRRTAGHVLRHSFSSLLFSAALPALLLAALLLFAFHSTLLVATLRLSALADRDPALRSLFHRLSSPSTSDHRDAPAPLHRPRSAPLRFAGAGDFFPDADPAAAFAPQRPLNASGFLFLEGAEGLLPPKDSSIRVPLFSSSVAPFHFSFPDDDDRVEGDRGRSVDPRNSVWGLDLDRGDATVMFYLLVVLSSTHSLAILTFIVAYTAALGMVFYVVIAFHLQRPVSVVDTIYSGIRLGIRRLPGFVFLRWAARDMLIQFLSLWFFADVRDQAQLFKLFVKVKLMPFILSPLNPWSDLDDEVLSGFFFVWALLDTMVSLVFSIMPWVVTMDHNLRRGGLDAVKEGLYLITLMPAQAIWIKFLETMICGNLGTLAATMLGGRLFAGLFHAVAEVYFMAVWVTFYFVARGKDGEMMGRRFGQRDLEDCFNELN